MKQFRRGRKGTPNLGVWGSRGGWPLEGALCNLLAVFSPNLGNNGMGVFEYCFISANLGEEGGGGSNQEGELGGGVMSKYLI